MIAANRSGTHFYMTDSLFDNAFFALLRSGLWEQGAQISPYEPLDFNALFQMAKDQSVVGLLAAGLEHVEDRKVTKQEAVPFLKKVVALENRNASMNTFIESLFIKLRGAGISSMLVKGQGIAQCYERPQWRYSGDVDLLLDADNYVKARELFAKEIAVAEPEGKSIKHQGMKLGAWTVELHGTLRSELSPRVDRIIDSVQDECIRFGLVRLWRDGGTDIFLPSPDSDVIFIFTHILKHFYKGGIGLRQICDCCRLLWTYRDGIDKSLLEKRLRKMRLMSEWKAFAAMAVDYLGFPISEMPLYDPDIRWSKKATRILSFIMKVGNFGWKRDMSYYQKYPYLVRKAISLGRRFGDSVRHITIFPLDSFLFFPNLVFSGLRNASRGE